MFTGLIENTALVSSLGDPLVLKLEKPFSNLQLGESIAVNGCCLTVIDFTDNQLSFNVSEETLRKTSLSRWQVGTKVNLERAMPAFGRLGGHFVLGHVDTTGCVEKVEPEGEGLKIKCGYPSMFKNLLIEKGSVALDGISLTVCDLTDEDFCVYLIAHTLKNTHLSELKVGTIVNLEFDVLGKYVQRNTLQI